MQGWPALNKLIWRNPDIHDPEFCFPLDLLVPALAALYGMAAQARRRLYGRGWLKVWRLPAPVISVGNLTVGGTGKTPLVAFLGRELQQRGLKVAILSRGYGGRRKELTRVSDGEQVRFKPPEVGEEAYWLAKTLPGTIVYTCPSRYEAGIAAWREHRPDLFLLDDGFQHFQLHRDLDIVLLDAGAPLGNGRLLPAGPLREPADTLAEAQVIVFTRVGGQKAPFCLELSRRFPDKDFLDAALFPKNARLYGQRNCGGGCFGPESLKNRALFAFAGIARPRGFAEVLDNLGVELRGFKEFPDHHPYCSAELRRLVGEAKDSGAEALITTAKDWARLGEKWEGDLPLWVLEVEVSLVRSEVIMDRISRILASARKNSAPKAPALAFSPAISAEPLPLPGEVQQCLAKLSVHGRLNGAAANTRAILVRAPNWVGDAVMALPVLGGLREFFPQARIAVLAVSRVAPLFGAHPQVADVLLYPPGPEKWRHLWSLRGQFDLAVALPNSLEAALELWLTGAKTRVGYNTDGRRPFLTRALNGFQNLQNLKKLHTVYYFLGILRAFGEFDHFRLPHLYLTETERAEAQSLLNSFSPERQQGPWVALSPGAAYGPAKRWPPERFAAVAARLHQELGARLVLLGGPEDQPVAAQVMQRLNGIGLNLVGRISLRQALAVLSRMALVLTNDSGLMHAAAALGVSVVAIFGSTDPQATGPFTDKATVLYHALSCSPCRKRTCNLGYPCLTSVSPDEVFEAARSWLMKKS